ncbi:MAG: 2-oxoglutarate dehydrogenase complex dihydrolipoyllysine-residue succinyltransferase [Pseudomonadota bacterium]|nr:2-oxoglutarate dehydrogenase complex dihydrolipoyllysine-residue succinyltransferase [Pseudomonadota bacterium]
MPADIVVPNLGESVTEATVAKWFKKAGDAVAADEPLVELETEKVTMEVNAPAAGRLKEIKVPEGKTVEVGTLLGTIEAGAAGAIALKPEPKTTAPAPAPAPRPVPVAEKQPGPAARKLLEETQIPSSSIQGTGKDGRITKGDVLEAAATPGAKNQAPSIAPTGRAEERVKMSKLRQVIAKRLKDSQNTAAILTTFNEIDMSNVIALRNEYKDAFEKKHGVRMGFMSFFVKAAVNALKEIPAVNAQIDGDELIYKNYYDIGVAVGTEQGLVVPVVRNADQLSFADIEKEINRLAGKAREGTLAMSDLTGGTFTVSNGGVYGSLMSTPIINPPQSGILGMHKTEERPIAIKGEVVIRPMMYVALSYDHRIIDGKESVTFLVRVKEAIEDPRRLLLGL